MATYTLKRKTFGISSFFAKLAGNGSKAAAEAAKGEQAAAKTGSKLWSKVKIGAGVTAGVGAVGTGVGALKVGGTLKDVATGNMGSDNGEGY